MGPLYCCIVVYIFPSEFSSQLVGEPVDDLDEGDKAKT
jgi:hypothetical protein